MRIPMGLIVAVVAMAAGPARGNPGDAGPRPAVPAGGSPPALELDMAHKPDPAILETVLSGMQRCVGGIVQIHYAFSQATITQAADGCAVAVKVTGELAESDDAKRYICSPEAVQAIPWLRPDAPVAELERSNGCRPRAEIR